MRIFKKIIMRRYLHRRQKIKGVFGENEESRPKKTHQRPGCVICKNKMCIDEKPPRIICRINSDMTYSGCMTRSMTKLLESTNDFIIYETYRCMPLLGDENENVPDWDIHIVRYTLVFNKINQRI